MVSNIEQIRAFQDLKKILDDCKIRNKSGRGRCILYVYVPDAMKAPRQRWGRRLTSVPGRCLHFPSPEQCQPLTWNWGSGLTWSMGIFLKAAEWVEGCTWSWSLRHRAGGVPQRLETVAGSPSRWRPDQNTNKINSRLASFYLHIVILRGERKPGNMYHDIILVELKFRVKKHKI